MNTDAEVIARSRADPAAFALLYDRHARELGAFAVRRVGSRAAEDVVADTFLVAFRKRGAYDLQYESARPWLYGIANRIVRKHRRVEAQEWQAFTAAAGAGGMHHDSGAEEVDARLDAQRRLHGLGTAIERLAQRDRDALLLYAWGGLSYEEVARALGVPTGTVRSRLNRVRRQLGAAAPMPATTLAGFEGGL